MAHVAHGGAVCETSSHLSLTSSRPSRNPDSVMIRPQPLDHSRALGPWRSIHRFPTLRHKALAVATDPRDPSRSLPAPSETISVSSRGPHDHTSMPTPVISAATLSTSRPLSEAHDYDTHTPHPRRIPDRPAPHEPLTDSQLDPHRPDPLLL